MQFSGEIVYCSISMEISQEPIIAFHINILGTSNETDGEKINGARPCVLSFHSNNFCVLIKLETAVTSVLTFNWGVANKLKACCQCCDGNRLTMKA